MLKLRGRAKKLAIGSIVVLALAVATWAVIAAIRGFSWVFLPRIGLLHITLIFAYSIGTSASYVLVVRTLVRGAGYSAGFKECYLSLTASQGINYIIPLNTGLPARVYLYKRLINVPLSSGAALTGLEALLGLVLTAFIAAWGFFFVLDSFAKALLSMALVLTAIAVIGLSLFLLKTQPFVDDDMREGSKPGIRIRIRRFVVETRSGLAHVSKKSLALALFFMFLNGLFGALRLNLVIQTMGIHLNVWLVFTLICMSVTAGNLSLIPLGLGVRDVSLTILLMAVGVDRPQALSLVLIQRLFNPGWPLLLGIISLYILGIRRLIKNDNAGLCKGEA